MLWMGEVLLVNKEGNVHDKLAVAMLKADETIDERVLHVWMPFAQPDVGFISNPSPIIFVLEVYFVTA